MIIKPAERLSSLQEYYFSKKLKEVADLKSKGKDIINLGIGSPDMIPDAEVISAMIEGALEPANHGYQPYQGIPDLKQAIVNFHKSRYDVGLGINEVLPLIGSKEGITHISLAYLNSGDQVLIPSLGYPTYTSVTRMVQAEPVYYPLLEDKGWEPDWEFLEGLDFSRIKLLWLNYPHMPTGTKGSLDWLKKFVDLARRKQVLLCHDNPYSFIQNDHPLSIFNVDGAKEVAVELNSLSKTFNMAGWRVGWVAGDSMILEPILRVKSNMDSGMFKPVQLAAVKALELGNEWFEGINRVYTRRRKLAEQFLEIAGCKIAPDQAGMFVWAKVGEGDADPLCDHLLYEKDVFVTPGHIFGEQGHQYIRISLCMKEEIIVKAIERIQ
ncbi:pyridoxal phosphate-dependent aminotransferase [Marinoscillum sp. MHG1-6]|uniref:pyridoxal phosphate-dependent aminotransferase n=1 Tax=Marinoscillum sp. MHG1-6 TaxID=2959627 RepID=UPI0021584893|nr:aminotransferase class I/II-fold pyridoxal phosphate-dependent enzyme [Marinoscillum sp. MHG1-6]